MTRLTTDAIGQPMSPLPDLPFVGVQDECMAVDAPRRWAFDVNPQQLSHPNRPWILEHLECLRVTILLRPDRRFVHQVEVRDREARLRVGPIVCFARRLMAADAAIDPDIGKRCGSRRSGSNRGNLRLGIRFSRRDKRLRDRQPGDPSPESDASKACAHGVPTFAALVHVDPRFNEEGYREHRPLPPGHSRARASNSELNVSVQIESPPG